MTTGTRKLQRWWWPWTLSGTRSRISLIGRRYNDRVTTTYLTLSSKKSKVQVHTIMVRSSPTPDPKSCSPSPTHEVQPKVSAHPVKHSCSEPAFPTWFYKAENQQPEEDQDSGQKAKVPYTTCSRGPGASHPPTHSISHSSITGPYGIWTGGPAIQSSCSQANINQGATRLGHSHHLRPGLHSLCSCYFHCKSFQPEESPLYFPVISFKYVNMDRLSRQNVANVKMKAPQNCF